MKRIIYLFLILLTPIIISCSDKTNLTTWQTNDACNLTTGSCTNSLGQQQITISLIPNTPIPVAKALEATITLKNINADKVSIDIAGVNMYMGFNRIKLKKVSSNVYKGQTMLAFCTISKMEWEVSVLIKKGNQTIKIPFKLTTHQQSNN